MGDTLAAGPGFGPAHLRARRDDLIGVLEEGPAREIRPTAPFDFDLTLGSFASFAAPGPAGVERYAHGSFARPLRLADRLHLVRLTNLGTVDAPAVSLDISPSPTVSDARAFAQACSWIMAAQLDLSPVSELAARSDPALHAVMHRLRGLRQPRTPDPFEALVTAVTEQLTSIKTAATLRARLVECYGDRLDLDGARWLAFPTPASLAAADPDDLRQLGLLGAKARCIVTVARAVTEGTLDLASLSTAPTADVTRALGTVRGIGPWTIAYVLGRGFGRYELVPEGDVALRAAVARHYRLAAASDRDVREVLAPYQEWKGLAAFYLIVDYAIARYRLFSPTFPV